MVLLSSEQSIVIFARPASQEMRKDSGHATIPQFVFISEWEMENLMNGKEWILVEVK